MPPVSGPVSAMTPTVEARLRDWSVFAFSFGPPADPARREPADLASRPPLDDARGLRHLDGDAIALVAAESRDAFLRDAPDLLAEVAGHGQWLTVLVPWKEPPRHGRRYDGDVFSFVAAGPVVRDLVAHCDQPDWGDLCYAVLHAVLNGELDVQRICVRQIGGPHKPPVLTPMTDHAALIMAHRGPHAYLETALSFIDKAASASMVAVRLGLDDADVEAYRPIADRHPAHDIYVVDTAPTGPYVIRQGLIEHSAENLLVFQDSDDISSFDRFVLQQHEMASTGADLVGCQEIEVDEISRSVHAYRFPRDVNWALAQASSMEASHSHEEPLLHATAMMRRRGFLNAGGLSTDQRIANDTQFMLRAYFSMTMLNSEEFLYIRRRHVNALTVAAPTAAGCELRRSLAAAWSRDFEAIKRGVGSISSSSLQPRAITPPRALRPFRLSDKTSHRGYRTA